MSLEIETDVSERFPGLRVLVARIDGVRVESKRVELQRFKEETMGDGGDKENL